MGPLGLLVRKPMQQLLTCAIQAGWLTLSPFKRLPSLLITGSSTLQQAKKHMMTNYLNWDHNPLLMADTFWPDVTFYKEQVGIIQSVVENRETVVVAGNKLGV
jgi:hypothetical protein